MSIYRLVDISKKACYTSSMRINPGESMESWGARVQKYEYGRALMRIAQGEDVDIVMESMSKAIAIKMLHPIVKAITDAPVQAFDAEAGRKSYEESYLKKNSPRADHIDD